MTVQYNGQPVEKILWNSNEIMSSGFQILMVNWTRPKAGAGPTASIEYATNPSDFIVGSDRVTVKRDLYLEKNWMTAPGCNNTYNLFDDKGTKLESYDATYSQRAFTTKNIKSNYYFTSGSGSDRSYTSQSIWIYK